jgi:hypothetical protein
LSFFFVSVPRKRKAAEEEKKKKTKIKSHVVNIFELTRKIIDVDNCQVICVPFDNQVEAKESHLLHETSFQLSKEQNKRKKEEEFALTNSRARPSTILIIVA